MPPALGDTFSTAAFVWAALLPLLAFAGTAGTDAPGWRARLLQSFRLALASGLWLGLVYGAITLGLAAAGERGMAVAVLVLLFGAIAALCHPQLRARLPRLAHRRT